MRNNKSYFYKPDKQIIVDENNVVILKHTYRTIYYRIIIVWCKWPFQDEVDEKYVEFYVKRKKRFNSILGLKMESNTSIEDKVKYLREKLVVKKLTVIKIK